jgi:hypothetical protein
MTESHALFTPAMTEFSEMKCKKTPPLNSLSTAHSPPKQSKMPEFMDDPPSSSSLKNTNYIDKITMECMMNKKHYKTYLEKTNPTRLRESRNLQNKIIRNSIHIENIFEELLDTSKKSIKGQNRRYNNKIHHAFYEFIEHSLQYIENEQENEADPTPEEVIQKELMRDYGEEVEEETRDVMQNKFMGDVTTEGKYGTDTEESVCMNAQDVGWDSNSNERIATANKSQPLDKGWGRILLFGSA